VALEGRCLWMKAALRGAHRSFPVATSLSPANWPDKKKGTEGVR
jgi:hypothetical protein